MAMVETSSPSSETMPDLQAGIAKRTWSPPAVALIQAAFSFFSAKSTN